MIHPGEHVSIFGLSGCGKSTLTRKIAGLFPRKVIFDRLGEWQDPLVLTCPDYVAFRDEYSHCHDLSLFTLIIRPKAGTSGEELQGIADQCLSLIYQVEAYQRRGIAVIFEEVWLYAPLHQSPAWFQETVLTGRHHRISIIGNSQRPANVSKTLVSQSRHVFIGQFFEARDRQYYRETLGGRAEELEPPERYQFRWVRQGYPTSTVST